MKTYSMFLGRKNQYCENDYTTNTIYRFNVIVFNLPMAFFTELEQKFHNSYGNSKDPKWPKQSWGRRMELEESTFLTLDYTTKLQSSRQYGTGTKKKYRPMEQDRKPRNKSMHLWIPYIWQRRQEYTMEQRQPLQ